MAATADADASGMQLPLRRVDILHLNGPQGQQLGFS
jgi:hypothetical protein